MVFLNHRIGQNFPRDAFDLGLRLGLAQVAVQRELEIFPLPNIAEALVAHLFQRALDGFALRVQDTLFERDVDIGFHR